MEVNGFATPLSEDNWRVSEHSLVKFREMDDFLLYHRKLSVYVFEEEKEKKSNDS